MRGGFDPGDHCFRPQVIGVLNVSIYNPEMGTYHPRGALALCTIPSKSAISQWGLAFHTVRGGFDPGDLCFRPQVVGVVHV